MSRQYLLPCPSCDYQIRVETSQAGQQSTCPECGGSVQLGTLREIRELEPCEPTKDSLKKTPTAKTWSPARRWVFVLGLAVMAFGSIWGGMSFLRTGFGSVANLQAQQLSETAKGVVDGYSPVEMRAAWANLPFERADEWRPSIYLEQRAAIAQIRAVGFLGLGIAAAGLVALLTAVAIKF